MRKTLLARSSPTHVTDERSMIDLPTDGSLPDGAFNDDHLGTLDAVRGAVHPISNGWKAGVGSGKPGRAKRAVHDTKLLRPSLVPASQFRMSRWRIGAFVVRARPSLK